MAERRLACEGHYHNPSSSAWPRLSGRAGCEAATEALPLLQRGTSAAEAHGVARRRARAPGTAAATRRRRARSRRRAAPRRPAAPAGPGRAAARAAARARPPAAARPAGPAHARLPQPRPADSVFSRRTGRALTVQGGDGAKERFRRPMPGWLQLPATGTCSPRSRSSLATASSRARCDAAQHDQRNGSSRACSRARRGRQTARRSRGGRAGHWGAPCGMRRPGRRRAPSAAPGGNWS